MHIQVNQSTDIPDISVILTTFKRPHLLPRALNSAIQQASADLKIEIIVCDDDPDQSGLIVTQNASKQQNICIRYIARSNQELAGVSASRNRGISEAGGEYIIFLDDDDELLPSCIENILYKAKESNADLCAGSFITSTLSDTQPKPENVKHSLSNTTIEDLLVANRICIGGYIILRNRITHLFDPRLKSHEDWLFLLDNIFLNSAGVSVIFTDVEMALIHIDHRQSENNHRNPRQRDQQTSLSFALIYSMHPSAKLLKQRLQQLSSLKHVTLEQLIGAQFPSWPKVVTTRIGRFLICNPQETIQMSLLNHGTFEPIIHLAALAAARLKEGLIIDVGANIGTFTIPTALTLKDRKFIAIEPQRNIYTLLNSNLLLNQLNDVVTVAAAIGEPERIGSHISIPDFDVFTEKYTGSVSLNQDVQKIRSTIAGVAEPSTYAKASREVDVVPLDRLAGDETVSVIKIDVEGMELDVLRSANSTIATQKPSLLFECWDLPEFKEHKQNILRYVAELGYRTICLGNDYLAVHPETANENQVQSALAAVGINLRLQPKPASSFARPSFYKT